MLGSETVAAEAGTVVVAKNATGSGYGNVVVIDHGYITHRGQTQRVYTLYSHLDTFSVDAGQQIAQGQVVGYVGRTPPGRVVNAHVHFEVIAISPQDNPGYYTNGVPWLPTGPNMGLAEYVYRENPFRWLNFSPYDNEARCGIHNGALPQAKRSFDQARTVTSVGSPIILDLDGDGVETVDIIDSPYFDHDGDGFAESTGWVGSDDGLLVWDRNGDGVINNGTELFGNNTARRGGGLAAHGFQALADWDDNLDGRIDASDAIWANLRIWRDLDGDGIGISQDLATLASLGIAAINTGFTTSSYVDPQGNAHRQVGSYVRTDSTTRSATDVWFRLDKVYSVPEALVDVPPAILALPGVEGFGRVYGLHQAMARDLGGTLRGLVETFSGQTDPAQRRATVDQLLLEWTASAAIAPGSRGPNIDARRLAVLEKFFGESWTGSSGPNPSSDAAIVLDQSYQGLAEWVYAELMSQTHLQSLYNLIQPLWDETSEEVKSDLSAVITELQNRIAADPVAGRAALAEFSRTLRGFGTEDSVNYWSFRETFATQDPELRWVIDSAGKNIIMGTPGDDPYLSGGGGIHDAIRGLAGNDYLNGCGGDDALYGDAGNDHLWGNTGNDLLVGGDGNDYLDGDLDDDRLEGGAGNDILFGVHGDDTLLGGDGNDGLYGGAGNDRLEGGAGDDQVWGDWFGGSGDDVLDGGPGSDVLVLGPFGRDVVLFNRGNGYDQVEEFSRGDPLNDYDQIQMGAGILPTDITVTRDDRNLGLRITGTSDFMLIRDYFFGGRARPDTEVVVRFANGTTWTRRDVLDRVRTIIGTEGNDNLRGWDNQDDIIRGLGGDDALRGLSGNDLLEGGAGNDRLFGDAGNDTLDGGAGNDYLEGGPGNDTYRFGRGGGQDTIVDYSPTANLDVVEMAPDILPSQVTRTRIGDDLILEIQGTSDRLTLRGYYDPIDPGYNIEEIRFNDGTVWRNIVEPPTWTHIGTEGPDTMFGTVGADAMTGLGGNDTMDGRDGNDIIYGGPGNDGLWGSSGDDFLHGGDGNDGLQGNAGADRLYGGPGDDILYGDDVGPDGWADVLDGGDGNDTLDGRGGNDTLYGGLGIDSLWGADGNDVLDGGDGNDSLRGGAGDDRLEGGAGDDGLWGDAGNDLLNGGDGNDPTLDGGDGDDIIRGGPGADGLWGGAGDDTLEGEDGNDGLQGGPGADRLYGGAGNDTIYGQEDNDLIDGGDGIDTLVGGSGDDRLDGGLGNDQMWGEAGNDVLNGGEGDDSLDGGDGDDELHGDAGADTLWSGSGNNLLDGGDGNDVLNAGIGHDRLYGGTGDDTLHGDDPGDIGGNDILDGGDGNDTLFGGPGDDVLYGGAGADTLWSGTGNNILDGDGNDRLFAGIGADRLFGGAGDDELSGDDPGDVEGNDILDGGEGNDTLSGGAGNDTLDGGPGNDSLLGGPGIDVLDGGPGDDTLNGGAGDDTLRGGLSNDTYVFGVGSGLDVIVENDATVGNTDVARFEALNPLNLILNRQANDLQVRVYGATDVLTVRDWYLGTAMQTEVLRAADGRQLLNTRVAALIQAMADYSTSTGLTWEEAIAQRPAEVEAILSQYWEAPSGPGGGGFFPGEELNPPSTITRPGADVRRPGGPIPVPARDVRAPGHALVEPADGARAPEWVMPELLPYPEKRERIAPPFGDDWYSLQTEQFIHAVAGFATGQGIDWERPVLERPEEVHLTLAANAMTAG